MSAPKSMCRCAGIPPLAAVDMPKIQVTHCCKTVAQPPRTPNSPLMPRTPQPAGASSLSSVATFCNSAVGAGASSA